MGDVTTAIVDGVRAANEAGDDRAAAIGRALANVRPDDLAEFLHPHLRPEASDTPAGRGLPASPGAGGGRIVLTADAAVEAADRGEAVVLVRPETTPDDVLGMQSSNAILTMRGGLASHAAVVARGWGIPAVVGATDVHIDGETVTIGTTRLAAGDEITVDGSTGDIYTGVLDTVGGEAPPELATLLSWAATVARGQVEVRVNADTDADAAKGREHGALGVGLCRTEHMFLAADRLPIMRRYILSDDPDEESAALAELEAVQIADFESLLDAMDGLPVTVRLLDPPLHEFLPDLTDLTAKEARDELTDFERTELGAARRLHETNPMIGTRGVRLAMVRRGVYEMQVRALCTAAANLFERGRHPHVEIMIPLVVDAEELRLVRRGITDLLDEIGHPELAADVVTIGAMIETPRAAITAGALAEHADFFSLGTNDLTQMTYGFSRDDVEAVLVPRYIDLGILPASPFGRLDPDGVGELVRLACEGARAANPSIKIGACGEHAGDPDSVRHLVELGVDSVSCSPFRVPVARLAVAQALLSTGRVRIEDVTFDDPRDDDASLTFPAEPNAAPDSAAEAAAPTVEADESTVLHVLRVRGFVTSAGFEASLGAVPADVLDALVEQGLVRYLEARDMYGLLPPGKERAAETLIGSMPDGAADTLAESYREFLALNDDFKRLCTDWQMRDGEPNDHADVDYDRRCVEALVELERAARPVLDRLAAALPRLGRYRVRLASAAAAVTGGDTKQFTGVMCESFHDVWMELHEDLILVQGIDRTAEGSF